MYGVGNDGEEDGIIGSGVCISTRAYLVNDDVATPLM